MVSEKKRIEIKNAKVHRNHILRNFRSQCFENTPQTFPDFLRFAAENTTGFVAIEFDSWGMSQTEVTELGITYVPPPEQLPLPDMYEGEPPKRKNRDRDHKHDLQQLVKNVYNMDRLPPLRNTLASYGLGYLERRDGRLQLCAGNDAPKELYPYTAAVRLKGKGGVGKYELPFFSPEGMFDHFKHYGPTACGVKRPSNCNACAYLCFESLESLNTFVTGVHRQQVMDGREWSAFSQYDPSVQPAR
ncbi:hypothetical protein PG994_009966 [Apiospora phragmitis]|uniref:Uncharacterized protein n=1 Tax=Apiospora phragmitis TaxID=2905665 RepID=A0ABR1TNJ5_9PEZI